MVRTLGVSSHRPASPSASLPVYSKKDLKNARRRELYRNRSNLQKEADSNARRAARVRRQISAVQNKPSSSSSSLPVTTQPVKYSSCPVITHGCHYIWGSQIFDSVVFGVFQPVALIKSTSCVYENGVSHTPVVPNSANLRCTIASNEKGKNCLSAYSLGCSSISGTSDQSQCSLHSVPPVSIVHTRTSDGTEVYFPNPKRRKIYDLCNIASEPVLLKPVPQCPYCLAKRFKYESDYFCCGKGTILLAKNDPPAALYDLFTLSSPKASTFQKYIRIYNNMFAMTSLGISYDKELANAIGTGVYTFRVHGQVHHFINPLIPTKSNPSYLQLYYFDPNHEVDNRARICSEFDKAIINAILVVLSDNPYCSFFRSLQQSPDLKEISIIIKADPKLNQKVYNRPSVSDIAFIWTDDSEPVNVDSRDIVVHGHSNASYRVYYHYGCYDPLQYPLLFPRGETGWHAKIEKNLRSKGHFFCHGEGILQPETFNTAAELLQHESEVMESLADDRKDYVSIREYYAYMFQIRPNCKSLVLRGRRLLQQYCVDMYIKLESARLDFIRYQQDLIRSDLYKGLVEAVGIGEAQAPNLGKRVILPATFIGGPRDMRQRYLDAMALVKEFGKPDIFLTMTCNPSWPEIEQHLAPGESAQDRPDLVARAFRAKLYQLKFEVIEKKLFGPVAAHVYVVEFQKRGLPHVHMLVILHQSSKLTTTSSYDSVVSAEIPDPIEYPHLHHMVRKHMMHGPCGTLNKKNVCMVDSGRCRNRYPRTFKEFTEVGDDEYAVYRRRDDGRKVEVRGHRLDNRWVVPYNPYLLARFNCHMNVEICSTIKAVKYLYKYIYKGHDRVAFCISADNSNQPLDEIEAYQTGRWVSPPEAMWRIFAFRLYNMYPPVLPLHLHLEGEHRVSFRGNDNINSILHDERSGKSMLTEFFKMNEKDPVAKSRQLLYKEFPKWFRWDSKQKAWFKRQNKENVGRIFNVSPIQGELFYLRLLLNNIRAPTSFKDLKTCNGITALTYKEAAEKHGFIQPDTTFEDCLEEACQYQMPFTLRKLFAIILVFCNPPNVQSLWSKFQGPMSEDFAQNKNVSHSTILAQTLLSLRNSLEGMGKSLEDYGFVSPIPPTNVEEGKEIQDERAVSVSGYDLLSTSMLNNDQREAFNIIISHVTNSIPGAFFVDGPGGTGKTFLYRCLLATVRSKGEIALATATSGVAASLLPGGRTAHSRFKIPLDVEGNLACNVTKQSDLAKLIKMSKLIIWDEASMAKRQHIELFNEMLKDVMGSSLLFGGKVVVFGGDFRQVLPVVKRGTKEDSINASLVKSPLWNSLQKLFLTINMRARFDPPFSKLLMNIGDGVEQVKNNNLIQIPHSMLISGGNEIETLRCLIDFVFPDISKDLDHSTLVTKRAILTPKNEGVDRINELLMDIFPGERKIYRSFDETIDPNQQGQYEDLLHTFRPSGLPPHELHLKPNCPATILRNINPTDGLCNGTRVICKRFTPNLIHAEIATGDRQGEQVFIPRIPLIPSSSENFPVSFKRTQFPIRPSFAMTINKAQGQTLDTVGLYLPNPCFSHGQLYVALSRAKLSSSVKVVIAHSPQDQANHGHTPNIVYKEILQHAHG